MGHVCPPYNILEIVTVTGQRDMFTQVIEVTELNSGLKFDLRGPPRSSEVLGDRWRTLKGKSMNAQRDRGAQVFEVKKFKFEVRSDRLDLQFRKFRKCFAEYQKNALLKPCPFKCVKMFDMLQARAEYQFRKFISKLLDMQQAEYQPSPFTSVVPNMDSAEVAKSSASLAYSSLLYGSEVYWAIALQFTS